MTGAIAMMRRADFTPLPGSVILDDVWMPMRLVLDGKRVAMVADAQAFDAAFEDDREFRRKVRTLTGNYQLFAMLPALLIPFAQPDLVRDVLPQDPAVAGALVHGRAVRGVAGGRRRRRRGGCGRCCSRPSLASIVAAAAGRRVGASAAWRAPSSC